MRKAGLVNREFNILDAHRRKALESGNYGVYSRLCDQLGIEPEFPEVYVSAFVESDKERRERLFLERSCVCGSVEQRRKALAVLNGGLDRVVKIGGDRKALADFSSDEVDSVYLSNLRRLRSSR